MPNVVPTFNATFNGREAMQFDFPDIFWRYCMVNFQKGEKMLVTVKKYRKPRSTGKEWETGNQNGYYWSVVLPIISEWSGHTVDELHEIYKAMFCPKKRYKMKNGREVVINVGTSELNTVEFTEYVERIRAEVAQDGVVIPDPQKLDS
jgi:hypothetical protein